MKFLSANTIGLALSGGGARGFAHIGVLLACEKFGVKPSILSGVSAGSIVAALYGAGLSAKDIFSCFSDYTKLGDFTEWVLPKESIFKLSRFSKLLNSWLPVKNLEETTIPTIICATDLDHGKVIGWQKGEIVPRVLASCSIPVIFNPIKIDGVNYVDGGVLRNLPAWAIRDKCKTLIGSNVNPMEHTGNYKKSILGIALRSFYLMSRSNSVQDIKLCNYIIQPEFLTHYKTFDLSSMKRITMHGYDCACKVLEKI